MATINKTTKKVAEKSPSKVKTNGSLKKDENVFAQITKTITQLCVGIVAIVVVFSPENTWILGPIIGSLAVMGIALGYFASR